MAFLFIVYLLSNYSGFFFLIYFFLPLSVVSYDCKWPVAFQSVLER